MLENTKAMATIHRTANYNKAADMLLGLITGISADNHLHDTEIHLLHHWLLNNQEVATVWPGSIVARTVRQVMQDGRIDEAERQHLLEVLKSHSTTNFTETGSPDAEVIALPYSERLPVIQGKRICLTGEWVYGTRSKCEALCAENGGEVVNNISKKLSYLIVGTNISPHWVHTSYGLKIKKAMELQQEGNHVQIVSERQLLESLAIT